MGKICKRGHEIDPPNSHWHKRADGTPYATCKRCHALLQRLRYHNNDEHREREKRQSLARYYRRSGERRTT